MSFDIGHVPDPYLGAKLLAFMWGVPTFLISLRTQLSDLGWRRQLLFMATTLSLGALIRTLAEFRVLEPSQETLTLGLVTYALAIPLAVLGLLLLRVAASRQSKP
jgi:hypothetical protein